MVTSRNLKLQPIVIPASDGAEEQEDGLQGHEGEPITETFVQTGHPDENFIRQVLGKSMQRQVLTRTQSPRVYQMRSWSLIDRLATDQLKIQLGFAANQSVDETVRGLTVSGGYFIKRV